MFLVLKRIFLRINKFWGLGLFQLRYSAFWFLRNLRLKVDLLNSFLMVTLLRLHLLRLSLPPFLNLFYRLIRLRHNYCRFLDRVFFITRNSTDSAPVLIVILFICLLLRMTFFVRKLTLVNQFRLLLRSLSWLDHRSNVRFFRSRSHFLVFL